MPRDVTWPMQFFAYNLSGKHFNPTSCGVIRNQRSKIRRSIIISTAGCPFIKISKFECRVIKHARSHWHNSEFNKRLPICNIVIIHNRKYSWASHCMQDTFARACTRLKGWTKQPPGQARATLGYLVYKASQLNRPHFDIIQSLHASKYASL